MECKQCTYLHNIKLHLLEGNAIVVVLQDHALELKSLQIPLKRIMDSLIICGPFAIFLYFFNGTSIKTLYQGIDRREERM